MSDQQNDSSNSKSSEDEDVRDEFGNIQLSDALELDRKRTQESDPTTSHITDDRLQPKAGKKDGRVEAGNEKPLFSIDASTLTSVHREVPTAESSGVYVEPSRIVQSSSRSVTYSTLPEGQSRDIPSDSDVGIVELAISEPRTGTSSEVRKEPLIKQSLEQDEVKEKNRSVDLDSDSDVGIVELAISEPRTGTSSEDRNEPLIKQSLEQDEVKEKNTSVDLDKHSEEQHTEEDKINVLDKQSKNKNSSAQDQSASEEEHAIAVQVPSDVQCNIDSEYREILKVDFKTMVAAFFEDEEIHRKVTLASANTLDDVSDLTSYEDIPTDSEGRPLPRPRSALFDSDSIESQSIPEEPECIPEFGFSASEIALDSASDSDELPKLSAGGEKQVKSIEGQKVNPLACQPTKAGDSQKKSEVTNPLSRLRQDTVLSEAVFQERSKWLHAAETKEVKVEEPEQTDKLSERSEIEPSLAYHHRNDWMQTAAEPDVPPEKDSRRGSLKGSESDSSVAFHQRDDWIVAAGGENRPEASSTDELERLSSLQAQSESDSSTPVHKRHKWLQHLRRLNRSTSENEDSSLNPKSSNESESLESESTSGEALGHTTSIESSSFETETTSGEPLGKTSESPEECEESHGAEDSNIVELEKSSNDDAGNQEDQNNESNVLETQRNEQDGSTIETTKSEGKLKLATVLKKDNLECGEDDAKGMEDETASGYEHKNEGPLHPSVSQTQEVSTSTSKSSEAMESDGNEEISGVDKVETEKVQESGHESASHQHDFQMPSTSRTRSRTLSFSRDSSSSSSSVQSQRQRMPKRLGERMRDAREKKKPKSSEGLQRAASCRLRRRGSTGTVSPGTGRRRRKLLKRLRRSRTSSEHADDLDSSDDEDGHK